MKGIHLGKGLPSETTLAERGSFRRLVPLIAVVALGLLLRLNQIGSEGLWIDEAFSIWLAQHPPGEMLKWVQEVDHHPPLYYGLLQGWTRLFGAHEGPARAFSALCGTLTIAVIYDIGCSLHSARAGLIAALVLALSPFHIRFAQEARMYTLLALFASMALDAFVRLRRHWGKGEGRTRPGPGGPWPWLAYVAATAAMLWTHNTAVFFPLTVNLVVLFQLWSRLRCSGWSLRDRESRVCAIQRGWSPWLQRWFAAQVLVLALWTPWFPALLSQVADVYRRFWLPPPDLGAGLSIIGVLLWELPSAPLLVSVVVNAFLVGLAVYGFRELLRLRGRTAYIATFVLAPIAGEWIVSAWRPILCARTLIWISIPLYVLLAAGIEGLGKKSCSWISPRALAITVVLGVVILDAAAIQVYFSASDREGWDEAAALVAERMRPDDLVLFNDAWGQIPFDYYLGQQYNHQDAPDVAEHGVPVDLFDRGVLEPRMTEADLSRLEDLVAPHPRVWLVYSHQWYTDPKGLVPQALDRKLNPRCRWSFDGLEVHLYGES